MADFGLFKTTNSAFWKRVYATLTFVGGSPTRPAMGYAIVSGGVIVDTAILDAGAGYGSVPTISIGGSGSGASLTAVLTAGAVSSITIVSGGTKYVTGGPAWWLNFAGNVWDALMDFLTFNVAGAGGVLMARDILGNWKVYAPEGRLATPGTTTQGLQEGINYAVANKYSFEARGGPTGAGRLDCTTPVAVPPCAIFDAKFHGVNWWYLGPATGDQLVFDSCDMVHWQMFQSQMVNVASGVGTGSIVRFLPVHDNGESFIGITSSQFHFGVLFSFADGVNQTGWDVRFSMPVTGSLVRGTGLIVNNWITIGEINTFARPGGILIEDPAGANIFYQNKLEVFSNHGHTGHNYQLGLTSAADTKIYKNTILFHADNVGEIFGSKNTITIQSPVAAIISSALENTIIQPEFPFQILMHLAANQSIPNGGAVGGANCIQWDTNDFAPVASMHSASSNKSRLVAPATGTYQIQTFLSYAGSAGGTSRAAIILGPNGSGNQIAAGNSLPGAGGSNVVTAADIRLNRGDYIEIAPWQDSGGPLNVLGKAYDGSTPPCYASMTRKVG